jgi:putative PIN family toxin of toxin-antitoxin system
MEKPRLVLDTNVVVSAVLKPDGLQKLIFQVALSPFCEVFVSAPILTEYEAVLSRKRFKFQPDEVHAVMRLIKSKAVLIAPKNTVTAALDPDDNIFLECAEESEADYLVTGNKKHFPAKWKRTKVVSGREMMTLMLRGLLEL